MWDFLVFWSYGCYDFLKPFQTPRGVLQLGTEGIETKASVLEESLVKGSTIIPTLNDKLYSLCCKVVQIHFCFIAVDYT